MGCLFPSLIKLNSSFRWERLFLEKSLPLISTWEDTILSKMWTFQQPNSSFMILNLWSFCSHQSAVIIFLHNLSVLYFWKNLFWFTCLRFFWEDSLWSCGLPLNFQLLSVRSMLSHSLSSAKLLCHKGRLEMYKFISQRCFSHS